MQYRKFGKLGLDVSALGFGMMRLPTMDDDPLSGNIDESAAITMLREAIDQGVNYVDTAYFYHQGASETVTGKALRDGYREKVFLATKSPLFLLKSPGDFDRYLEEQLQRLQTDCIDFYLLHGLNAHSWENVALKFDLINMMERAKKDGKIKHIGFSFHDQLSVFQKIVDSYSGWEFCQIQLNYLDVNHQAGLEGLRYAAQKGLGVVVMEPLGGGNLAKPPQGVHDVMKGAKTKKSPVEWALDFVWNQPEVSLLLSGMGDMQQVVDNVMYASRSSANMLDAKDQEVIARVQEKFKSYNVIPCTRCGYCMPCPNGIDIPGNFEIYNHLHTYDDLVYAQEAYERQTIFSGEFAQALNCVACKECEQRCPQHIPISEWMPKVDDELS